MSGFIVIFFSSLLRQIHPYATRTIANHRRNGCTMNMKLNTIAMAVLTAGLIGMVTGKATEFLYDGGPAHPGGHHEEKRGYSIEVAEDAGAGGAPAAAAGPGDISALLPTADIAAGADFFGKKCSTCHTIEQGEPNKVGPNLYGIMGAPRAHAAGFSYSDGMKNAGGKWGWDEMNTFQWNPKKAIPGTIMAYAGNKKDQERANLIAYLNSKGSNLPLPPVKAPEAAPATEPATEMADKAAETK
jgi:cytochrome c